MRVREVNMVIAADGLAQIGLRLGIARVRRVGETGPHHGTDRGLRGAIELFLE